MNNSVNKYPNLYSSYEFINLTFDEKIDNILSEIYNSNSQSDYCHFLINFINNIRKTINSTNKTNEDKSFIIKLLQQFQNNLDNPYLNNEEKKAINMFYEYLSYFIVNYDKSILTANNYNFALSNINKISYFINNILEYNNNFSNEIEKKLDILLETLSLLIEDPFTLRFKDSYNELIFNSFVTKPNDYLYSIFNNLKNKEVLSNRESTFKKILEKIIPDYDHELTLEINRRLKFTKSKTHSPTK